MDNSFEQCVRKPDYTQDNKKYSLYRVLMIISIIGAAVGLLLVFMGLYYIGAIDAVLWGGIAFLFYRLMDGAIIEYDYEFSDGAIRIARISNRAKRKELAALMLDAVEAIAPYNKGDVEKYTVDGSRKLLDCTLNSDSRWYYILASQNGKKLFVLWEPKQELLKLIRNERRQLVTL